MKQPRSYPYKNETRTVELRNWCDARKGRSAELSSIVHAGSTTGHLKTGLSHYKSGRNSIKDNLYKKIKSGIKIIEKNEIARGLNIKSVVPVVEAERCAVMDDYFVQSPAKLDEFNRQFKLKYTIGDNYSQRVYDAYLVFKANAEFIIKSKENLSTKFLVRLKSWLTPKEKKRKIRLCNAVYSMNFTNDKLLTSKLFEELSKSSNLSAQQIDFMEKTINKVDDLIESNHPFAIAAANE